MIVRVRTRQIYGYYTCSEADALGIHRAAQELFQEWAAESEFDPRSPITWHGDTTGDCLIPMLYRPGGANLASDLEPGDLLIFPDYFPFGDPRDVFDVVKFLAGRGVTLFLAHTVAAFAPEALTLCLPLLDAMAEILEREEGF